MNSRKKRRYRAKAQNITWQDVWVLPLHLDKHGSYAWSANGTMALTFETGNSEEEFLRDMEEFGYVVERINGNKSVELPSGVWTHDVVDFFLDGKYKFCVRGWGQLTGCGAMNLPEEEAERIQDGFIEHIFKALTE